MKVQGEWRGKSSRRGGVVNAKSVVFLMLACVFWAGKKDGRIFTAGSVTCLHQAEREKK